MRAVEDGHFIQADPFVLQFLDALGDESGLVLGGRTDDQGRLGSLGSGSLQVFGELVGVASNHGVGESKDGRRAAVVDFDAIDPGSGMAFRKGEDVAIVGPAPGIDALGVIADGHDLVVVLDEKIDDAGLDRVGVLVFVDEDMLESGSHLLGNVRMVFQQFQPEMEQVVEVNQLSLAFLFLIALSQGFQDW